MSCGRGLMFTFWRKKEVSSRPYMQHGHLSASCSPLTQCLMAHCPLNQSSSGRARPNYSNWTKAINLYRLYNCLPIRTDLLSSCSPWARTTLIFSASFHFTIFRSNNYLPSSWLIIFVGIISLSIENGYQTGSTPNFPHYKVGIIMSSIIISNLK